VIAEVKSLKENQATLLTEALTQLNNEGRRKSKWFGEVKCRQLQNPK
jgi:hypothetical protein